MAKLILRAEGGAEEKEILLDEQGSVTIGRSPDCDLEIGDTQSSRRHCSVVKLQSGWEVADLGSTNGTLLNSTLVKRKKLRHGDVIRIGHTEIQFQAPDSVGSSGTEMENCFLVYSKGEHKGDRLELIQQRTTIGRKETNTVPLQDLVASSYHCEIVRDLNGYTIRDLGSTNGTLVNNEMVTEAQLTHGARIRIGNTRFVFQDPAMAEIDLELAGVDDDESEWGMMRELDLAAVRRRSPARIIYTLLLLGLIAAGYFYVEDQRSKRTQSSGPVGPEGNLHGPYSFETEASVFTWTSEPPGSVDLSSTTSRKVSGERALELRTRGEGGKAFYLTTFRARGMRYQVTAQVSAGGGATAQVGLLWRGNGLKDWRPADTVEGGGFVSVDTTQSAPPWATSAVLGVVIEGAGTVTLDDVAVVPAGSSQPQVVEQNQFRVTITDGTEADIDHAGIPILAAGHLIARDANDNPLDASGLSIESAAVDGQHVQISVNAKSAPEGTARVGIAIHEVAGYLTNRGGFRPFGAEDFVFPMEGVAKLSGVRKILLGPAGRSLSVIAVDDDGLFASEIAIEGRRKLWRVLGEPIDGVYRFRFKTDRRGEVELLNRRLNQALTLYQHERFGEFAALAADILAEFPFAPERQRERLQEGLNRILNEYTELSREANAMLVDYDDFKDMASLLRVRRIARDLQGRFQVKTGEGARGKELQRLIDEEAKRSGAAEQARQAVLAGPVFDLAKYVAIPNGEIHSAAVLLYHIAQYLPDSPQAVEARAELEKIKADHPYVIEVLDRVAKPEN